MARLPSFWVNTLVESTWNPGVEGRREFSIGSVASSVRSWGHFVLDLDVLFTNPNDANGAVCDFMFGIHTGASGSGVLTNPGVGAGNWLTLGIRRMDTRWSEIGSPTDATIATSDSFHAERDIHTMRTRISGAGIWLVVQRRGTTGTFASLTLRAYTRVLHFQNPP